MALTGEQIFKGLTISNVYLRVMDVRHRAVDSSTEAEDETITWDKILYADYSVRIYKDEVSKIANPDSAVTTISGSFTPSVANSTNMNIVKQTYEHLKTLSDFSSLTDV